MEITEIPDVAKEEAQGSNMDTALKKPRKKSVDTVLRFDIEEEDSSSEIDPLEGLDVDPSERDFVLELLANAPPSEIEPLALPSQVAPQPKVDIQGNLEKRQKLEAFAKKNPLYAKDKWSPIETQQFNGMMSEYARYLGMGKNQVQVEVMKLTAGWRRERGLAGGNWLDEGLLREGLAEVAETLDKVTPSLVKNVSKGIAPDLTIAPPVVSEQENPGKSKKRKLKRTKAISHGEGDEANQIDADETNNADIDSAPAPKIDQIGEEQEVKRQKKEAKAERHSEAERINKLLLNARQALTKAAQNPTDGKEPVSLNPAKVKKQYAKTSEKRDKKKNKHKLGPKKSSYFEIPEAEKLKVFVKDLGKPLVKPKPVIKPGSGRSFQRRQDFKAKMDARGFSKRSKAAVSEKTSGKSVVLAPEVPSASAQNDVDPSGNANGNEGQGEDVEPKGLSKKSRRKRNRNKNRLQEEQFGTSDMGSLNAERPANVDGKNAKANGLRTQADSNNLKKAKKSNKRKFEEIDGPNGKAELSKPTGLSKAALANGHTVELNKEQNKTEGAPSKRRNRTRGKKAKTENETTEVKTNPLPTQPMVVVSEPLAELPGTNVKKSRRKRKSKSSAVGTEMEIDTPALKSAKVHHS